MAQCRLEDVHDIAFALGEICDIAEQCNRKGLGVALHYCQFIDISKISQEGFTLNNFFL